MEGFIISLLTLSIWLSLDRWIESNRSRFQETKCIEYHQALETPNPNDWEKKRYQTLKRARFLILGTLFVSNPRLYMMIWVLSLVVMYKLPYWRLRWSYHKKVTQVRYLFPIYLRQLQVLLQNNTVVKAIEASIESVPSLFKSDIQNLYQSLSEDPLCLDTYLNCMSRYHLPEIQRAMKWLYRYQSIGQDDAYRQFNRMISSTSKWLRQTRLESKSESIQIYQWLGMFPLLGVTLVFLSAMMSLSLSFFERG